MENRNDILKRIQPNNGLYPIKHEERTPEEAVPYKGRGFSV